MGKVADFRGIPVYKDPAVPLERDERDDEGKLTGRRVPVDYLLIGPPGMAERILVHPDRWDAFLLAIETTNELLKGRNN